MRMIFGVLSLLFVVAIVGVMAKRQLAATVAPAPVVAPGGASGSAAMPVGTPQQQVQQVQQAVQGAMQARPLPDNDK